MKRRSWASSMFASPKDQDQDQDQGQDRISGPLANQARTVLCATVSDWPSACDPTQRQLQGRSKISQALFNAVSSGVQGPLVAAGTVSTDCARAGVRDEALDGQWCSIIINWPVRREYKISVSIRRLLHCIRIFQGILHRVLSSRKNYPILSSQLSRAVPGRCW